MGLPRNQKTRAGICLLAIAVFMSPFAIGDWAYITPEELAAQSDVIVLGECVGSESVALDDNKPPENIGVIRVESVLKGDPGQSVVLLLLPPTRPGGLVASGDIAVTQGQRGLWYLKKKKAGLYRLDRPDSFVDIKESGPRIKMLGKAR